MAIKGANLSLTATNRGGAAMASFQKGLKGIRTEQTRAIKSNHGFMKGMSANRRIIQNVGFQVSDLGVQIAGGQSAILSLTQNVPQVVQMFGAWGAILAALITIIGTLTIVMIKSGQSFADIAPLLGIAQEELEAFGRAMLSVKDAVFNSINFVLNNLDLLLTTLTVIAAFLAGKYIAAKLAAAMATRTFATAQMIAVVGGKRLAAQYLITTVATQVYTKALVLLKKALVTTGIGALIVGAGYLVERLFTLKKATGDWGETFALVGKVVMQSLMQIPKAFAGLTLKIYADILAITGYFTQMFADITGKIGNFLDYAIGAFVGFKGAVHEIFKTLNLQLSAEVLSFVNGMIEKIEGGINKAARLLNILPQFNLPVNVEFGRVDSNAKVEAGTLGERMGKAFSDGLNGSYIGEGSALNETLNAMADVTQSLSQKADVLGDELLSSALDGIPAWKTLTDLLAKADADKTNIDIRNLFGKGDKDKDADKAFAALDKRFKRAQEAARQSIGSFKAILDDSSIDSSVDRYKTRIMSMNNIPAFKQNAMVKSVDELNAKIKTMAPAIQVELDRLDALNSSGLKQINADAYFAQTEAIVTKVQQMSGGIVAEIDYISNLHPELGEIGAIDFLNSLTKANTDARGKMDNLRGIVGEHFKLAPVTLPDIKPGSYKKDITDLMKFSQELGQTVGNSIRDNMKGLITGTKSLKDALSNVLDRIASKIADFAIDSLFAGLGNAFGGSGGGGLFGSFFSSIFSFDGGGFTGSGARSGGVDGKGGFPAILHPNETVVDHTKTQRNPNRGDLSEIGTGYSQGGQAAPVTITNNNYFNGVTREEVMADVEQSQNQMKRQIENNIPSQINKHRFNQSRGVA